MSFASTAKAIGGFISAGAASAGTVAVTAAQMFPPGVEVPWYGYVIAFVAGGALGYLGVYVSPKNAPS